MKNIKQIREAYNVSTNKSEAEDRKLSSLVECGLLDANKLPALKEAMNKPVDQMSSQEKRMFLNLLESLISEMQVRQTKDIKDYFATPDPRVKRAGYPSQKEAPSVLLLKRKAIRVFPDGQKVALYYAQAIDKYVSIPYNEIGINEQTAPRDRESEEEERANTSTSSALSDLRAGVKASTPMRAGGSRLNVTSPIGDPNVRTRTAIDSYMERLQRRANQAMAQNEETLNEAGAPRPPKGYVPPKIRPKAGIGPGGKTAPEKSTWEKLTDVKDDGTITGMGKDLLPVVGTVRQAKRTGAAYRKTASDLEKGNYWDAAKGAADTALQGGLTAVSGVGDVLTATGIGAPVVAGIRGAVSAAKMARTASNVNKFIATSKTIPVKTTPALPAPETKTVKPAQTAAERKTKYSMDLEVQRETNRRAAEAMRKAAEFRTKYPKTKDTSVSAIAKEPVVKPTKISVKEREPKEIRPSVSTVTKKPTKISVKEREPSDFKLAEPATSKGQLVPVSAIAKEPVVKRTKISVKEREPSDFKLAEPATSKGQLVPVSAREPSDFEYNKSNVGKFPEPSKDSKTSTVKKTEPRDQTQTLPVRKKPDGSEVKTKKAESPSSKKSKKEKKKTAFDLPSIDFKMPGKKPLQPGTPSLRLAVSGPTGKPHTALDAADLIRSRKAMMAQASMSESVNLDGNIFELNNITAQKVKSLYESLNRKNKKKMIEMMSESNESFNKVISFAVRQ